MQVLSLVTATVPEGRQEDVVAAFAEGAEAALPPGLEQTFLLVGEDGELGVATVWSSREALDAMRASGEEPFARRVLREAGGDPVARFYDVAFARRS